MNAHQILTLLTVGTYELALSGVVADVRQQRRLTRERLRAQRTGALLAEHQLLLGIRLGLQHLLLLIVVVLLLRRLLFAIVVRRLVAAILVQMEAVGRSSRGCGGRTAVLHGALQLVDQLKVFLVSGKAKRTR